PGRLHSANSDPSGLKLFPGSKRILDPVEAHEREAVPFGRRTKGADLFVARHDRQTGNRRKFIIGDRHDAAARAGAMLDSRHNLLPDIAALVEIDAVELIHIGFMRKRIAIHKIKAAARNTERDAMSFVGLRGDECGTEISSGFRAEI